MASFPTPTAVQSIAAMPDGAARNRAITTAYFELSTELRGRFTGAAANWCTFATWASRLFREIVTAISHREVDLVDLVTTRIGELGPLRRAGEAVARGNRKVFEEIGLEFARFVGRFHALAAIGDADFDDFLAGLRDGEPPDGQRLLRQAFRAYRRAALAASAQERAECLLFANLSIGYHEQVRLQPEIREALDAAVIDKEAFAASLLERLAERDGPFGSHLRRRLPFLATPLRGLASQVAGEVSGVVREIVTEHLMTLRLDRVVVRLGRDVQQPCPPELQHPSAPDLVQFLAAVDPDPDGPRGSGAEDWADFLQRMHFIAELFRAWQQDERLFAAP